MGIGDWGLKIELLRGRENARGVAVRIHPDPFRSVQTPSDSSKPAPPDYRYAPKCRGISPLHAVLLLGYVAGCRRKGKRGYWEVAPSVAPDGLR